MVSAEVIDAETETPIASDDSDYEIVHGRRVELIPMGAYAYRVAFKLASKVEQYAESREIGRAVTETLFRLQSSPNIQRRPDAAFISFGRWPADRPTPVDNAWDIVPELVVEVVSPTNLAEEILTKVREYFEAGVQRAWILYVHESLVYEYDSPRSIRVLGREGALEGGDVIPGFRLPLADLFEVRSQPGPA